LFSVLKVAMETLDQHTGKLYYMIRSCTDFGFLTELVYNVVRLECGINKVYGESRTIRLGWRFGLVVTRWPRST